MNVQVLEIDHVDVGSFANSEFASVCEPIELGIT
jgi:hypothetical protein